MRIRAIFCLSLAVSCLVDAKQLRGNGGDGKDHASVRRTQLGRMGMQSKGVNSVDDRVDYSSGAYVGAYDSAGTTIGGADLGTVTVTNQNGSTTAANVNTNTNSNTLIESAPAPAPAPKPADCSNMAGWKDSGGNGCELYLTDGACGIAYLLANAEGVSATTACCRCDGGTKQLTATPGPAPEPSPGPTPDPTPGPTPASTPGPTPGAQPACPTTPVYTDVVIIGAGMAGIAAAATLQNTDPNLDYVILESTNRVGGRVRSKTFGVENNQITVEDGANWIYDIPDNPIWAWSQNVGLDAAYNDVTNLAIYDESGRPIDRTVYLNELGRFNQAWDDAVASADNQWTKNHARYYDNGVQSLLLQAGWSVGNDAMGNLDYTIQWESLDWEYAMSDTSIRYFPYEEDLFNGHVADRRGYEFIPQTMFANGVDQNSLRLNTRVQSIHYNEWELMGQKRYRGRVDTLNSQGCQVSYFGQRVISTVSAGVLEHNLISFNPPLSYNRNPYHMVQYEKIFFQFPTKFWDDTEFIRTVRDLSHRGECNHWQSMDVTGKYYQGSHVIRCEMVTETYQKLAGSDGYLSQETLLQLLDPLRVVYGADAVRTPLDMYYPALNKDADFGYGAYANWKQGFTFTDFAEFFGGTSLTGYCQHNGCNNINEWVLVLSGSAACYDFAENVHGAYFAGEKAATNVLTELGYKVKSNNRCDTNWKWLQ